MNWPYFDASAYRDTYADVREAEIDPFEHYRTFGWREGRKASAYLDTEWYVAAYLDGGGDIDPVTHYLEGGWQRGCKPNMLFDPAWYLKTNSDVAEAGVEPLNHFASWGWREGRKPSIYFDVDFYLRNNVDVAQAGFEPLAHYLTFGWRDDARAPNPLFDPGWYRARHGDRIDAATCALRHYIAEGAAAGLAPGPRFDPAFYRETYADVAPWGEALAHYLDIGRHQRRQASPDGQPAADPDVAEWAAANAFNDRRAATLSRALGVPLAQPGAAVIAQTRLRRAMIGIDVVTFDIFDTLIERRSGRPETIFALLAQGAPRLGLRPGELAALRRQGENEARGAAGLREVTMAEIWDHVGRLSGLTSADCALLAAREAALEVAMCEPKAIGIDLFRTALAEGRQVHLLSDIYLDRPTVEAILNKAGIAGYGQLYISSEIGGTKHHGGMFTLLLAEQGVAPARVLHIGDNPHSDVAMPRRAGIRAMQIAKSDAMTESDALRGWFGGDWTTPDGLWRALVAGELVHREATMTAGTATMIDRVEMAGARALGPVLLGFAQYLAKKARQFGHRRLYFASRDGFYLREAYELLRSVEPDLPPSRYVLASRRVCRAASIRDFDDVLKVAAVDHFPMTIRQFLSARFLLSEGEIAALPVPADDLDRIVTDARTDRALHLALQACKGPIIDRCGRHAAAYRAYLRQSGIGDPGSALVDIGYRGTTQSAISAMIGTRLDGLYLVTWPEVSRLLPAGLRYDAFVASDGGGEMPFVRYVQLLELLCSATHGSIAAFEPDAAGGRPVMLPSDIGARTGHTLNALRKGALDFIRDILATQPSLLRAPPPSGPATLDTFVELCARPPLEVVDGLSEHVFEDIFGGAVKPLIGNGAGPLTAALAEGCWPEGTTALRRLRADAQPPLAWPATAAPLDRFDLDGGTCPAFRPQAQEIPA